MERYQIADEMLEKKVNDYLINSNLIPKRSGLLSKTFARELGINAGKMISVYNEIFQRLENNDSIGDIKNYIKRYVSKESKVKIKLPLVGLKPVRICGLVALNYSGFFDKEIDLYSNLIRDFRKNKLSNKSFLEDIISENNLFGENNKEKYKRLLKEKQQSIYDFGVLMGLTNDDYRLNKLKERMNKNISQYFEEIVLMHKGNRLGISWPLPLKKFSKAIETGLKRDSISYMLQKRLGEDFGFEYPKKADYKQMIKNIKTTLEEISSSNFIRKKLKAASLPASLFFLNGFNAYAQNTIQKTNSPASDIMTGLYFISLTSLVYVEGMNFYYEMEDCDEKLENCEKKGENCNEYDRDCPSFEDSLYSIVPLTTLTLPIVYSMLK